MVFVFGPDNGAIGDVFISGCCMGRLGVTRFIPLVVYLLMLPTSPLLNLPPIRQLIRDFYCVESFRVLIAVAFPIFVIGRPRPHDPYRSGRLRDLRRDRTKGRLIRPK